MTADELSTLPFFADLSAEERERVAPCTRREVVPAGLMITTLGERGDDVFYVIEDGRAHVEFGKHRLGELGPGDFFGEIALLGHGRRTATVTTTTSARVFVLFRDDFHHLQTTFPAVAADIDAAMKDRFGRP